MKSKLLVMASVIVAAIAVMSVKVNAYSNSDLIAYVTSTQTLKNGESVTLTADQKKAVTDYLNQNPVDDATAASIKADLDSAKAEIEATGEKKLDKISESVKSSVVSKVKVAASKAGVVLNVDTKNNTVTFVDQATGKVISSTNYSGYASTPAAGGSNGGSNGGATGSSQTTSGTLVYTGASTAVYVLPALAIVAIATLVVVRKRS